MVNLAKKLRALVEQESSSFGLFLVAQTDSPSNLYRFYLDSEEPLSMKSITDFTKHISEKIDAIELSSQAFTFEISSPGADRPLVHRKQYPKHVGRSFDFETLAGKVSGVLKDISANDIFTIEQLVKEKGKKAYPVLIELPYTSIISSTIIINLK
ncbi:MAG: hypothetical protein O3B82_05365 [Bacteroidetes bacterium]|nr:hypothetical protein [Bacteroidota bacterium]